MPATGGYGASGVPDIIVSYRGKFIGLLIDESNVDMLDCLILSGESNIW